MLDVALRPPLRFRKGFDSKVPNLDFKGNSVTLVSKDIKQSWLVISYQQLMWVITDHCLD